MSDARKGQIISAEQLNPLLCVEEARNRPAQISDPFPILAYRDRMEEYRALLQHRGYNLDVQSKAAELKLWAERRMGELLPDLLPPKGRPKKTLHDEGFLTLEQLG